MTLTANRDVDHYIDQELRTFQMAAAAHLYKGAFVGLASTGYARPLVAGDAFVGIAYEEMDNTSGADGDLAARVYTLGDFGLTLTGATIANVGQPVFASADDTVTFAGAGNSYVGTVQDVLSAGEIILRIDPGNKQVKSIIHDVSNLSAGADINGRAMHAFETDGWIASARVVNQGTAAAGIDNANTCVIALTTGAGNVVTTTFDATNTFPAPNTAKDLGTVNNVHVGLGDVLTLAVTNGTTADPGPFLVCVDYV